MPTIPILTAERQGVRGIDLPGIPAPPKIVTGFEQLREFGETLGTIADRLQKQDDDVALLQASTAYDFQFDEATLKLKENPNFYEHESLATKNVREISDAIRKRFNLQGAVDRAFVAHVQRRMPKDLLEVKTDALKLQGQHTLAGIEGLKETLSTNAAEAVTPEGRDDAIRNYVDLVTRAEKRGLMNPLKSQEMQIDFKQKMLEKNMDFLRRTGRDRLYALDREGVFATVDPIKRLKILEAARTDEQHEQTRAQQVFNEASKIVKEHAYGKANFGALPQSELEDIKANRNPFINAIEWHALNERNENAPSSEGNLQVRVLHQEFGLEKTTVTRIHDFRQRAEDLARELGHPNKELIQFLDYLNSSERATLGLEAARLAAGIKDAIDQHKSERRPFPTGDIGQMQHNKWLIEEAEIKTRMQRGEKKEDILKDIRDRNARKIERIPPPQKDMLDLDRRLK